MTLAELVNEKVIPAIHSTPAKRELARLAPDLARLALDMGEYLRGPYSQATANALLTRLDGIVGKDETT